MKLNKIYNADCLDPVEGMARLPDSSVDMILCDLPYGTTQNKWDGIIPFNRLWEQYDRIIKDNGAILLFSDEPFTSKLVCSKLELFRQRITWNKLTTTGFLNAKKMLLKATEDICLFYKKLPFYNPILVKKEKKKIRRGTPKSSKASSNYGFYKKIHSDDYDNTMSYPTNLIEMSCRTGECNNSNKLHPTQKLVELFEYLIKTYTKEGETILDNCMGSGTTAIACMRTGRNYIGWEKDPEYYEVIQKRISDEQKELAKKWF